MKTLLLTIFLLIPHLNAEEKVDEHQKHALKYFEGKRAIVKVSVSKSYFWQTTIHKCDICTKSVHDIITIFKVVETYKGKVPVGAEICCHHRRTDKKSLKEGDVYVFDLTAASDQVQFLDVGMLVPFKELLKRER